MLGRQAKVISAKDLKAALLEVSAGAFPERDRAMILLSVRAGLRACEMAGLSWAMVLKPNGAIGETLEIRSAIAKKKSGRRVPMHPDLMDALRKLWRCTAKADREPDRPVLLSARGAALKPNSIVNWFVALYGRMGLAGCSSHSGRRTFITTAARKLHHAGASLRDVQIMAGHASIETTQRYIDGDSAAQRKLVTLL